MKQLVPFIYLIVLFAIFYFLMIRPQQQQAKKRQEMLSKVQRNDNIVTAGGIHGKVTKVKDNTVMVKIAENVEVEVAKSGIGAVLTPETKNPS